MAMRCTTVCVTAVAVWGRLFRSKKKQPLLGPQYTKIHIKLEFWEVVSIFYISTNITAAKRPLWIWRNTVKKGHFLLVHYFWTFWWSLAWNVYYVQYIQHIWTSILNARWSALEQKCALLLYALFGLLNRLVCSLVRPILLARMYYVYTSNQVVSLLFVRQQWRVIMCTVGWPQTSTLTVKRRRWWQQQQPLPSFSLRLRPTLRSVEVYPYYIV